MSQYLVDAADLQLVADAIRRKTNVQGGAQSALIFPNGFVDAINGIGDGDGAASFCITAEVSLEALKQTMQGQAHSVTLESGITTQAIQAFQAETPVAVLLSILMASSEDGTESEEHTETPVTLLRIDLHHATESAMAGTSILQFNLSDAGAPINWLLTLSLDVELVSDSLVLQIHPERIPNTIQLTQGESLADDEMIGQTTVADLKTNSGLTNARVSYPIYGNLTATETREFLTTYVMALVIVGLPILLKYPVTTLIFTAVWYTNPLTETVIRFGNPSLGTGCFEAILTTVDSTPIIISGTRA